MKRWVSYQFGANTDELSLECEISRRAVLLALHLLMKKSEQSNAVNKKDRARWFVWKKA